MSTTSDISPKSRRHSRKRWIFAHGFARTAPRGNPRSRMQDRCLGTRSWKTLSRLKGLLRHLRCHQVVRRGPRADIPFEFASIMVEDKKANRRRQVAVLAARIDRADKFRQRYVAFARDLLQFLPERVLEINAGLVTGDDDGTLYDCGLHCSSSPLIRY